MQNPEPILIPVGEACCLLGIGRTLLYQMAADGRLGPKPVKLGNKTLFRFDELRRWVIQGG